MKTFFKLAVLASFLIGCTNTKSDNSSVLKFETIRNYEMISEVKSETSNKAQLIEYAVYKDTIYTKDALRIAIMDIYNINKDKKAFTKHDNATVIGVYLFTSKEAFNDKANWIAMLIKRPGNAEPEVTFNNFKISALGNVDNKVKSADEIELEKLKAYLKERGLELCAFAETLKKIELDNIHKADHKYPDYGDKHMAMVDRLDAQSYRELRKKYKLSEDMLGEVAVFAMSYCK
ncbi:hypothetical protein ABIB40_000807 [Pedobacter sp. UYP30]|uniref:hypothetical protein n=1 Tax=Pedobacter sp. UYP30 TaxID=1756400 RepID=UPI0033963C83